MNAKLQSQLREQIKKLDSISTAPAILKPLLDMLRLPSDQIKIEKVIELVSYDGPSRRSVCAWRILRFTEGAKLKPRAPRLWRLALIECAQCCLDCA